MKQTAMKILRKHASYIDALKEAIDCWEHSNDMEEKRDLMIAIGEICAEIHLTNRKLGLR